MTFGGNKESFHTIYSMEYNGSGNEVIVTMRGQDIGESLSKNLNLVFKLMILTQHFDVPRISHNTSISNPQDTTLNLHKLKSWTGNQGISREV